MDIEFGRDDSMVRRIARARCAEHPDSAKNWHYRSVTGRLSLLSDSANSWHYRGTLRFGANVCGTNHRVPRAKDNSAVNLKFQNVVTSHHVATNVQDNSPVNFLCT